ncbi:MAG: hypothetical protein ACOX6H_02615 [Christensenellales bacterium]|jgi:hypothetical protein
MELEEKLEKTKSKLKNSFLCNVDLKTINYFVSDRYLVLVDLKYAKTNIGECIVLKCENIKGFVTKEKFRYLYLYEFNLMSDNVYISSELKLKWIQAMERMNAGKRVNGKNYFNEFLKFNYGENVLIK